MSVLRMVKLFGWEAKGANAYSCGFDSTVRTWDVENGVCVSTIVSRFLSPSSFFLSFLALR